MFYLYLGGSYEWTGSETPSIAGRMGRELFTFCQVQISNGMVDGHILTDLWLYQKSDFATNLIRFIEKTDLLVINLFGGRDISMKYDDHQDGIAIYVTDKNHFIFSYHRSRFLKHEVR